MSLYERNSIQLVNNEKAIYCSFACDVDEEYDYLLLDNIDKISLTPKSIKMFSNSGGIQNEKVIFKFIYDEDIEPERVFLVAEIYDFTSSKSVSIELQDLVNSLCQSIYEGIDLQEIDLIKELKDLVMKNIGEEYLQEKGILLPEIPYNTPGIIYNDNDEATAIINNFATTFHNGKLALDLKNVVSYISLKDAKLKYIKFNTGIKEVRIREFEIIKSSEGLLKDYTISVDFYDWQESDDLPIETIKDIDDKEMFFDKRATLLSRDKFFVNEINNNNDMNEMFDDFDFDL